VTKDKEVKPNALLVEDNSEDRLKIKLQLEVMGFSVFDVSSTAEAREIFSIRDYSLALIHLGHAPLESLEICRQILRTNSEYRFLQLLMENPERIFSKEQVLQAVSSLRDANSASVETYAHQLRTKIKRNGGPDVIDVVRSVGFRLQSLGAEEKVS